MSSRSRKARMRPRWTLPKERRSGECADTAKRRYRSRTDAVTAAAIASRGYDARPYYCSFCSGWHLTSKPKRRAA